MTKKTMKNSNTSSKKVTANKASAAKKTSVIIKPNRMYTQNEVREIFGMSKGTALGPKHFGMKTVKGKIDGASVIARLEHVSATKGRGRRAKVRIGRKYASGSVTVVAR